MNLKTLREVFDIAEEERKTRAKAFEAMKEALLECADGLEAEIEARYPPEVRKYPSMRSKYELDRSVVLKARAALKLAGDE